ncbi:MAG TPA: ankyrin repeat domain-containing protein [Vicinamibacterales bacterium]|nr:ankyrin repeat domain-containing protein [Vicinamibacterales bacterium]
MRHACRMLVIGMSLTFFAAGPRVLAAGDTRLADAAMRRDTAAVRKLLDEKVDVNAPGPDGTPALHWLVRVDDFETARRLIRAGADASKPNRYGVTPMQLASANGNAEMIALLLEAGADPNVVDKQGETALMSAARVGSADAVKTLLDHGATIDTRDPAFQQTALMIAIREDHPDVVKLLVARGAQVNVQTRTGDAPAWILPNSVPGFGHGIGIVRGGLPDRGSRYLIPGAMTPLLYAARDGRIATARVLLTAGAEIDHADANGITPLLMAITNNHVDMARYLIDQGANVRAVDWYGRTPLWAAIELRNMDVDSSTFENGVDRGLALELVKVLLDKGVDVNARTKEVPPIRRQMLHVTGDLSWVDFTGQTPFLRAALAADLEVMRVLLAHGADPKVTAYAGTTALMAAAGVDWVVDQTSDEGAAARLEAVKMCYDLGLSVNDINSMGITAVMGAANRGSDDIIEFLVSKGAKLDVKDKEGRTPLTWAEGVFLATHPAKPKPSSVALIKKLMNPATAG